MKQKLIARIARIIYPQQSFSAAILRFLRNNTNPNRLIIDAPCGNGETTFGLSHLKNSEVFGYDISATSIQTAKRNFSAPNLHFETCDIFSVFDKHPQIDCFCMINSLFLLPKQNLLLQKVHQSLTEKGYLILILPNIDGPNYIRFKKGNPNVNTLELRENEFKTFFASHHFNLVSTQGIAFVPMYGRKDVRLFSIFAPIYLNFLNFLYSFIPAKKPNYFFLALNKKA